MREQRKQLHLLCLGEMCLGDPPCRRMHCSQDDESEAPRPSSPTLSPLTHPHHLRARDPRGGRAWQWRAAWRAARVRALSVGKRQPI